MSRPVRIGIIVFLFALVLTLVLIVWQRSQNKTVTPKNETNNSLKIRKVDLASQPEWVQKLTVSAQKGVRKGERGLDNVKISLDGMPKDLVSSLSYTIAYTYKTKDGDASGGFFSSTPVQIEGKTSFSRSFDFGTCSSKSCVRHDGVTGLEIEFDFVTSSGDQPIWTGTVNLQ